MFTRRIQPTKPVTLRRLARLAAGLCVCAALAADPGGAGARREEPGGGAAAPPLRVYVTWLDLERKAAVLAFRSRDEKRRVVVGVAEPFQTGSASGRGHIYQIPGFQENVPQHALDELRQLFRGVLPPGGAEPRFTLVAQLPEGGSDLRFEEIDQGFLDYVHATGGGPADLEVWDVSAPTPEGRSHQTVNVVFVGDLVLMKSKADLTVRGRVEAAMVNLLSRLAREEGAPRKSATLSGDCGGSGRLLALNANPSKHEERRAVRDAAYGGLSGPPDSNDEYTVVHTGWNKKSLRLNVEPAGARADITPTTSAGDVIPETGLELHPCVPATVRVEPRVWYQEFRGSVSFTRDGETLTARVPALGVRRWLVLAGSVPGLLLVGVGFRSFVRLRRARRAKEGGQGGGRRATVFDGGVAAGSVRKSLFNFLRRSETPESAAIEPPPPPPAPPAAEELQDLLHRRGAAYEEAHKLDGQLDAFLEKTLQDAQSSAGARRELLELRAERDGWVNTLRPLGETPEEALRRWEEDNRTREYIEGKLFEINSRLNGADAPADTKAGDDGRDAGARPDDAVGFALKNLSEAVPALRSEAEEYRGMARRILLTLDPPSAPAVTRGPLAPDRLADEVEGLRRLLEEVLQKYAGPLRLGADDPDLGAQPVASLKERFERLVRRSDALGLLESDERIRRARAISGELAHAGRLLRGGGGREYDELLGGSDIEPAALAQDLLRGSKSLDAALSSALSKLAGAASDDPGRPERFNAKDIDGVLVPFTRHLLLEAPAASALLHMLRLWQIMRAYCRNSRDAVANDFYERGREFRRCCEQVVEDLARLGVRLHPVRFFEGPGGNPDDPAGGGWDFTEVSSVPSIQNSPRLYAPIRDRLNLNFEEYGRTVADVYAWGFDCDLSPELKRPTQLWLWGWDARGSAET
ncbi:MAG TPA: hypothetical protein VGV38_06410 [Pyrinomonadaceae bacterium]|nr:hypothetical protein [Pyrinomonadaceae bacterium]